jgi:predicted cation transporter
MRIGACATVAIVLACATARADDEKVKVEVRGDADAVVEQAVIVRYPEIDWKELCTTPCTVQVPSAATVRVTANGLSSNAVQVEHDAILRAQVPAVANASAANDFIVLAGLVLAYGATALPIGVGLEISEICIVFCNQHVDHTAADWLAASGGIATIMGVILLGVGFHKKSEARPKLSISSRGVSLNLRF